MPNYVSRQSFGTLLRNAITISYENAGAVIAPYLLLVLPTVTLQIWAQLRGEAPLMLVGLLISTIVGLFAYGVVVVSVSELCLGNRPKLARSLKYIFGHRLGKLLGASLLQMGALIIGFILFVIPGFVVIVWFAFTSVVVVLEDLSPVKALKRSKALGAGYHLRTAGALVLFTIVVGLGSGLMNVLAMEAEDPFLFSVGSMAVQVLATPVLLTWLILIYYDLRVRKEGYDTAGLAENLSL